MPGGGSLSHISPVLYVCRRELAGEGTIPLPADLQQMLVGQLGMLWQALAGRLQAEVDPLETREQADVAEADTERDRSLDEVRGLRAVHRPLREQLARQNATCDHLAGKLEETRSELLALVRGGLKGMKEKG